MTDAEPDEGNRSCSRQMKFLYSASSARSLDVPGQSFLTREDYKVLKDDMLEMTHRRMYGFVTLIDGIYSAAQVSKEIIRQARGTHTLTSLPRMTL